MWPFAAFIMLGIFLPMPAAGDSATPDDAGPGVDLITAAASRGSNVAGKNELGRRGARNGARNLKPKTIETNKASSETRPQSAVNKAWIEWLQEREIVVSPVGGTLVIFKSAVFAHQVLSASRERLSLTGWFLRR